MPTDPSPGRLQRRTKLDYAFVKCHSSKGFLQGLLEILDEIRGILESDGEPHRAVSDQRGLRAARR